MAKQTLVHLTDDLDGTDAAESVTFALRGQEFEIDLNAKNVAALEKCLTRYIEAGRRVPRSAGRPSGRSRRPASRAGADTASIREWAQAQGYEVSGRGRISASVREAFEAAHG